MKQEEKLTQLIQTWDNKEKAQAIKAEIIWTIKI